MRNRFYDQSLTLATRIAGKPVQLAVLSARLLIRLNSSTILNLNVSAMKEKLEVLGRLISAYARGRYRRVMLKAVITVVAAVLYFLNPFDLLPDALPGLGLTDDFAVLSWVYHHASNEVSAFLQWEASTVKFTQ